MEKIKEMLAPGSKKGERRQGTAAAGVPAATTIGMAGYGVVGDQPSYAEFRGTQGGTEGMVTYTTTTTATTMAEAGEAATCGHETFTKVEDRPVVIEQKERLKEHRPVEKEFVQETRAAGVKTPLQKTSEGAGSGGTHCGASTAQ